jgi:hypothetical protein
VRFNLFPGLKIIKMDDFSALTKSFCKHLTSAQHLVLLENSNSNIKRACLNYEQEKALQLLTSLQNSLQEFQYIFPLCYIGFLRRAFEHIHWEFGINDCSAELNEKCRMLAKRIKVKIDRGYVI